MQVHGGGASVGSGIPSSHHSKSNKFIVGSGGATGMSVFNGTGEGWYAFSRANANNTDAYDGGMSYNGDRNLGFHTNAGARRMQIDGDGTIQFGDPAVGGAANVVVMPQGKLFLDAGGDTYIHESAGNRIGIVANNVTGLEILNAQVLVNGILQVTGDNPLQFDGGRYFRFQRDSNALHLKRGDTLAHIGTFSDNGAYAAVSDERLKDNINTIAGATSKVKQLRGVTHTWKPKLQDPDNPTAISYGLIAQEVEAVIPEVVKTAENEDGYKAVAYDNLVPLLIETIKELEARITILEG
jgi:hypothetical protein